MKKDILRATKKTLVELQKQSSRALDIVTSTINQLLSVNEKIDSTIVEIEDTKAKLNETEKDLEKTKVNNVKIINRFKALIEG